VPYPPRGYWAKKAAGKNVISYQLPPADVGTPQNVRISPTPPPVKPPELPAEVKAKVEAVRTEVASITVPERLQRPHHIIATWLAEHDRRKRESRQERDPWRKKLYDPGEISGTTRRIHRILDTLFKALEKQGGKAKEGDRRMLYVEMQGEKVDIQIREKQKQGRRPLTDSEKRFASPGDKDWRQELQPTGKLVFTIKTYLPGSLQREWIEGNDTSLESMIPDIVGVFVAAGPLLVEQRLQQQEAERQRQIAERKRYEEEQQRKLDNNRWRRFTEFARQQRDCAVARDFLAALKSTNHDPKQQVAGNDIADWMAWAERRLMEADPLNYGAPAIFETISRIDAWTYHD
jgi:hypothetical protein